ncbi:unnamed protein product [Prorocentrum cordatum]|uniref:Uncharacterized protein n=1 Tax=Prorocentrum cordatum TaxID=2364126 RepID=A0ABN9P798_9DINO|nr:unnamed protein product [Polarella glacialis]
MEPGGSGPEIFPLGSRFTRTPRPQSKWHRRRFRWRRSYELLMGKRRHDHKPAVLVKAPAKGSYSPPSASQTLLSSPFCFASQSSFLSFTLNGQLRSTAVAVATRRGDARLRDQERLMVPSTTDVSAETPGRP